MVATPHYTGIGDPFDFTETTPTGSFPVYNHYDKIEYEEIEYEEDMWWLYNWTVVFIIKILLMLFLIECRCRSPTN